MRFLSTLAIACLTWSSTARTAAASRVLAALDTPLDATEYSIFWRSLKDSGYSLDVKSYEESAAMLRQQDHSVEHLIIFGSASKGIPAELSPQRLSNLINTGTNVLLALAPNSSETWREWAREFDVDMAERGTQATDHFTYNPESDNGTHTSLALPLSDAPSPFVSASTRSGPPLLYDGALHATGRTPLLQQILKAPETTFSAQPNSQLEDLRYSGGRCAIASGFQARNNARVTFVGSVHLFTDRAAESSVKLNQNSHRSSGNRAFVSDLARWTFGMTGQRQVVSVRHGLIGADLTNPKTYRVKDEIHYMLDVKTSPGEDAPELVQLEFTMLDPHLRIPLVHRQLSESIHRYEATFTVPDRHGVFTLRVDHRRPGWSTLEHATVVSVTPPRHDEYERFIRGAVPYYGGALSVSMGLVAFVVFWVIQS